MPQQQQGQPQPQQKFTMEQYVLAVIEELCAAFKIDKETALRHLGQRGMLPHQLTKHPAPQSQGASGPKPPPSARGGVTASNSLGAKGGQGAGVAAGTGGGAGAGASASASAAAAAAAAAGKSKGKGAKQATQADAKAKVEGKAKGSDKVNGTDKGNDKDKDKKEKAEKKGKSKPAAAPEFDREKMEMQQRKLEEKARGRQAVVDGNGNTVYEWEQDLRSVLCYVRPPAGVTASMIDCKISSTHLRLGIKGADRPYLDADLPCPCIAVESVWTISDGVIEIQLEKMKQAETWPSCFVGEFSFSFSFSFSVSLSLLPQTFL